MYFCFKFIFYLSWIFNCIWILADEDTPEDIPACPEKLFRVTHLDHSSLLVNWDPNKIEESHKIFKLYVYYDKGTAESSRSISCYRNDGRCKIPSLKENTSYRIEIKYEQEYSSNCWIVNKTITRTIHSFLTKPDFELKIPLFTDIPNEIQWSPQPVVEIKWLPCGRKEYCEEEEVAGSHFYVTYKMLYSRQEWRTYEYDRMNKFLYGLLPGKPYEVVITSIINTENGDFKTDSDPQEVFFPAVCSSVRSANIMTLSNSSVLISWEAPKQCQIGLPFKRQYMILYRVFDSSPMIFLNYSYLESPYKGELVDNIYNDDFNFVQKKIFNLTAGSCYTFFIVPFHFERNFGFEYRIDHTLQTYHPNLTLAQPEFRYEFSTRRCRLYVWWFPCGQKYDCKDTKPGLYYLVKYRNMTDKSNWEKLGWNNYDPEMVNLRKNQEYKISVESRDEYNNSKSSMEQMVQTLKCKRDDF